MPATSSCRSTTCSIRTNTAAPSAARYGRTTRFSSFLIREPRTVSQLRQAVALQAGRPPCSRKPAERPFPRPGNFDRDLRYPAGRRRRQYVPSGYALFNPVSNRPHSGTGYESCFGWFSQQVHASSELWYHGVFLEPYRNELYQPVYNPYRSTLWLKRLNVRLLVYPASVARF